MGQSQGKRASHWDRLQRAALTCVGLVGTVGLLSLAGCPADLANPQDYQQAATSTGGAGGAPAMQPGLDVDTACLTAIFTASCTLSVCHSGTAELAAHLDLASPGVNKRLIDIKASHETATGCKTGDKLIDSANPDQSWLLLKLTKTDQVCGSPMPIGPPLAADQIACVTKYTQDVHAAAVAAGM